MKKCLTVFGVILLNSLYSQINIGGNPYALENDFDIEYPIEIYETPRLDMDRISKDDDLDELLGIPPRFGFKHEVSLNPKNHGTWIKLNNGDKLWQLEVVCPNALSINFTFDRFWLPKGSRLYVYSKDKQHIIGAFSNLNNKGTKEKIRGFATGLVYGDKVIIEYYQPQNEPQAIISINGIVHGYRYIPEFWKNSNNKLSDFGDSGSCQVNVNCSPEGDNWQDEKTGIALILVDGNRWCSGSLVNNTCEDGKLYFLTAEHCLDTDGDNVIDFDAEGNTDLSSFSFLWNYEAPGCNNPINEPSLYITNGAVLKANNSTTDFALFELDESPYSLIPSQKALLNGWSNTNSPSSGGVGIHHPRGDIKKISTHTINPISNTNCRTSPSNWWEINWSSTLNGFSVQQRGSSGSPLFMSSNKRIIGQLFGPGLCDTVQCDSPGDQEVVYGRFSESWDGNTSSTRQLKHWLDPCNKGITSMGGGYLTCTDSIYISYNINNVETVKAKELIEANNTIQNGADVEYLAGEEISLLPGFEAVQGSEFEARIEDCDPEVVPPGTKWAGKKDRGQESIEDVNDFVKVYPNPVSKVLNIELFDTYENGTLSIYDMYGRNLYEITQRNKHKYAIDVSDFASGVYILNYQTKEGLVESKKFIVEK